MAFRATDPFRDLLLSEVEALDTHAIARRLDEAHEAQREWRRRPLSQRTAFVERIGALLTASRDELAECATREMGKTIAAARAEVDKCALLCERAVQLAPRALAPERITEDALGAWRVEYQPLGLVLAVMPWNFPYWQAMRVIVPNVLAGNGVLHKPASSVPGCAQRLHTVLSQAAHETGTPEAIAPLLLVESDQIAQVIAHPRVAGVTLTGSERAGASVARTAGEQLKKVVLELGGSDPFIVLADADVERAARAAATSRMLNNGQSCIAAKRFVVCDAVYDAFLSHFTRLVRALRVGDPMDPRTDVGPMATRAMRDDLDAQVQRSVAAGARVAAQAAVPAGPGYFYPPTVLVDVPDGSPAADDELFGPVASVFRVADADAALHRANATRFGLGASVWTRDPQLAARFVADLEAGMVFVNELVVSDPRVPFGGVKQSGMGRELGTPGFREFTNTKTVRVAE
jgi:succinate-semialdehyde dehydrogenase / glutarate-semialdehyde dehydrogenase